MVGRRREDGAALLSRGPGALLRLLVRFCRGVPAVRRALCRRNVPVPLFGLMRQGRRFFRAFMEGESLGKACRSCAPCRFWNAGSSAHAEGRGTVARHEPGRGNVHAPARRRGGPLSLACGRKRRRSRFSPPLLTEHPRPEGFRAGMLVGVLRRKAAAAFVCAFSASWKAATG